MTKALIIGISGQDGTYLSELLKDKGYEIFGTSRNVSSKNETRINPDIKLFEWDLLEPEKINEIIKLVSPDHVYNFAGYTTGSGMFDDTHNLARVNGLAPLYILEAIRDVNQEIKYFQASSSEIFGEPLSSPQSESTQCNPRSPYGAAKLFAQNMIGIYKKKYNMFACNGILYNHESPLRSEEFVTKKIICDALRICNGKLDKLKIGNLQAVRDWGYAGDYVDAMFRIINLKEPEDFIISTGIAHTVADICDITFSYFGLNYKDYIQVEPSFHRKAEKNQLIGDNSKLRSKTGWKPKTSLEELLIMMIEEEKKRHE